MAKSKKIISLLLSVIMIMSVFNIVPFTVNAAEAEVAATAETEGDFEYDVLDDGTARIKKYKGEGGDITIPSSLGGYTVTSIGAGVFEGCTSLTEVNIPDSVTSIGNWAFLDCTGLTRVDIPDSVTSIGDSAFSGCTGLTSIDIPDSVTSIGENAFYGCTNLKKAQVNQAATNNFSKIFNGATSAVDTVIISDTVTSIGYEAFYGCTGLTSVTIPDSVTSIGWYAFNGCTSLTSIDIPGYVKEITGNPFSGCTGMTSIKVDPENRRYDSRGECNAIIDTRQNVLISGCSVTVIPDSVTSIGWDAFESCTGLTSVTIPDSVTSIGAGAFESCTGLTSVTIPDSVREIGSYAFSGCTGLMNVNIPSVIFINSYVFKDCTKLKSIVIPASVTSIDDHAFDGCDGLVVYGYEDSYAEEFAWYNYFDFVKLTSDNDESAGVIAEIPEDSELNAAELTGKQAEAATAGVTDRLNIKAVFDISIKKDGAAVQPDCIVKVQILCEHPDAEVYRKEADGSLTDMNAVYKDGYYVFYTDHFSIYFVATAKGGGMTVSGSITSYVDDSDVTIKLTGVDNNFTAETNGKADYSIEAVPAGKYTLTVSKDNHVAREYTVTVADTDVTQDVKVCPKGDVNGDGETDIMDCSLAQRYIRELTTLDAYQIACGDVSGTGDGELDIQDVSRILRHIRELAMLY